MDHIKQYKLQSTLKESLEYIQEKIRADASNLKRRIFLFQLLVVQGSWDRGLKQLEVIEKLDERTSALAHTYRAAIRCELLREAVFSGKEDPVFMGEPEEWQALILQALKLTSERKDVESQSLRNQAFELAPSSSGYINGEVFEWVADADPRLGPTLEVILDGRYLWVPFSNILRIKLAPPENLQDVVWMPANIQWRNEGESFVLIPTRYPFSSFQEDELALSKKTEWEAHEANMYIGYGQRMLTTNANDYPLMDLRDLTISLDLKSEAENA